MFFGLLLFLLGQRSIPTEQPHTLESPSLLQFVTALSLVLANGMLMRMGRDLDACPH